MKRIFVFLLFLILLMPAAHAGTYKIGVEYGSYMPYFGQEDGKFKGLSKDILDLYAQDRGHKFIYVPLPIPRLNKSFHAGQIDFRYPDNKNWADPTAPSGIIYSDKVMSTTAGILTLSHDPAPSLPETLGIIRGFHPIEYKKEIDAGDVQLVQVVNLEALIRMGQHERVPAIYGDVLVVKTHLIEQNLNPEMFHFQKSLAHSEHSYHLSTYKHDWLIKDFNIWLAENKPRIKALRLKNGFMD